MRRESRPRTQVSTTTGSRLNGAVPRLKTATSSCRFGWLLNSWRRSTVLAGYQISKHAISRAIDMALGNEAEILRLLSECLAKPDTTYDQGNGAKVFQRGK